MKKSLMFGLSMLLVNSMHPGVTRIKNLTGLGPISFRIVFPAVFCSDRKGYIENGKEVNLGSHGSCEATGIYLDSVKMSNDEMKSPSNFSFYLPLPDIGGSQNIDLYVFLQDVRNKGYRSITDNPEGFLVEIDVTNGSETFLSRLASIMDQAADSSKKLLIDVGRLSGEITTKDLVSVATGGVSDIAGAVGGIGQAIVSKVGPEETNNANTSNEEAVKSPETKSNTTPPEKEITPAAKENQQLNTEEQPSKNNIPSSKPIQDNSAQPTAIKAS